MAKSISDLNTEINAQLPTNNTGAIGASNVRLVLSDIVNNITDPTNINIAALIVAIIASLPTTLPATRGVLWINNGMLSVS